MATTYTSFTQFPLEITGITSEYNARLAAIEAFIVADMAYSGDASDLTAILPYFIYWFFVQNETTTVTAKTGENASIQKTSYPEINQQVRNWNIGVDKLRALFSIDDDALFRAFGTTSQKIHALVLASGKTINEKYLSKRSLL